MSAMKAIAREINDLTSKLIGVGLCVDSNFPSQMVYQGDTGAVEEVSISGTFDASIALRERPYSDTYTLLRETRAFNIMLIDGALLQFRYRFQHNNLTKHVLGFFPSPDLVEYQNDPDLYENDLLFSEAIARDTVTTPVRFDFDQTTFQDYVHPASHFTIGQYKNCRIPVIGGITPFRFVNFVLRAFYNTAYHEFCAGWRGSAPDFGSTVTAREQRDLHWHFV